MDNDKLDRLNKNLEKYINAYQYKQVVARGFVNGIFSALGATIGFAIVVFILAQFINILGGVPFISNWIGDAALVQIIENTVQELEEQQHNQQTTTPEPTAEPIGTPIPTEIPEPTASPTVEVSPTPDSTI